MNYEAFFNFKEKPFTQTPDPDFYFSSDSHKEAIQHLLYCIRSDDGFIEISGNSGTGKTLIIRALLKQIAGENINVAFIVNSNAEPQDLLNAIAQDFGLDPDVINQHHGEQLLRLLYQRLIQLDDENIIPVVIIDEAQNLRPETLEQLCLISNLETEKKKLVKIILVGQLELEKQLNRPEFQKIHNRITIRYQLKPLTLSEMAAYIHYRIRVASASSETYASMSPFPRKVLHQIYRYSKGIPRIVNTICDRALMAAFIDNKRTISPFHVKKALKSLLGEKAISVKIKPKLSVRISLFCLLLLLLIYFIMLYIPEKNTEQTSLPITIQEQTDGLPAKNQKTGMTPSIVEPKQPLPEQKTSYSFSEKISPTTMITPDSLVVVFSPDVNRMVVWKGQMNFSFLNKTDPSNLTQINTGVYFLEKDFPVYQAQEPDKTLPLDVNEPNAISLSLINEILAKNLLEAEMENPITSAYTPVAQMMDKEIALPVKKSVERESSVKKPKPAISPQSKKQTQAPKKKEPDTQAKNKEPTVQSSMSKQESEQAPKKEDTLNQFPQEMISVPEGNVVIVISPDINRLFVWKGTSMHPKFVHQEALESSLKKGIYLLGKYKKDQAFMFHTDYSSSIPRPLIETLWEKVGKRSSNCVIPVLVSTSKQAISHKQIKKGRSIQLIVHQWVEAWRLKDFQQFMNLFNNKQILFYKINKPAITLAWEVLKSSQANIFSQKTQRVISASRPVCLLDPRNPNFSIALFNQVHTDNNYSESGVKVFFLRNTDKPDSKVGWIIDGRLWMQDIRMMETVP
jgi:type II secretory pathway predicted ATPase ExeA